MLKIYDIEEWMIVARDFDLECICVSEGWFAYDKKNHSIVGHFDSMMGRGFIIKW